MAYSLTQFENNTQNSLVALDNNTATLSAQAPIPCVVSGTNALTLTPSAVGIVPSFPLSAYTHGMTFSAVAGASNTNAVTAQVGTLPALSVYKDTPSGPIVLGGFEIIAGNAFSLNYDSTLNTGAGGFHLISNTSITNSTIKPAVVQVNTGAINNLLAGTFSLTFTATPGWSSQDQVGTITGQGSGLPAIGDFVQLVPPSLAAVGVSYQALVTAVGSVSSVSSVASIAVRLNNAASASLASNSGVYHYLATRTTT